MTEEAGFTIGTSAQPLAQWTFTCQTQSLSTMILRSIHPFHQWSTLSLLMTSPYAQQTPLNTKSSRESKIPAAFSLAGLTLASTHDQITYRGSRQKQ